MDRAIPAATRLRRRLATLALAGAVAAAGVAAFVWLPRWLAPSLDRSAIRVAAVDRGRVEGGIEASGTVLPAVERVLSSPVEARVLRILRRPGEVVRPGDMLLEVDTSESRLELERLEERVAGKRNEQDQLRLTLDQDLSGLTSQIDRRTLDLEILRARAQRGRRLSTDGLVSAEALHEADVEVRKAEIEVAQLTGALASARTATAARLRGVDLEAAILSREATQARRQLELAGTRADLEGVVTWVPREEGVTVARGEPLARIARLDAFRVEATAAAMHAPRLEAGMPARVLLDGRSLPGTVTSVHPAIDGGSARFVVDLDDPSDPALRPHQRLDVMVVTGARDDVLRVRRGSFAAGGRLQPVFVVEDGAVVRRMARFGLTGRDTVEVLEGLDEGDTVVLTDLQHHVRRERIALR